MSHLRQTTNRRCVFGCDLLVVRGVALHSFPNPNKQPALFDAWVSAVGNHLNETVPMRIYKNKRVCDHHFSQDQKARAGRLVHNAVPSINLHAVRQSENTILELEHNYCFVGTSAATVVKVQCGDITPAPVPCGSSAATCNIVPQELKPHASTWANRIGAIGNTTETVFETMNISEQEPLSSLMESTFVGQRSQPKEPEVTLEPPTEEPGVTPELPTEEPDVTLELPTEEPDVTLESSTEEPEVTLEHIEEGPFSWQKVTENIDTLDEEHPVDDDVTFCSKAQLVPDVGQPASPTRWEWVSCDVCQARITGYRYACVQCADFDLCGACEARDQHASHYVLRIPLNKTYSEAQAVVAALRRTLADHSALPHLTEVKEEVKIEDPLAEVEASTEVYMQADVDGSEDMQGDVDGSEDRQDDVDGSEDMEMEEEYLELDSLFSEDTDADNVNYIAPTAPVKRKMTENADMSISPIKRTYIRHRTQKSSVPTSKETNIEQGSSFVDDDTISSVQASNENRLKRATKSSQEHRDVTGDTQFLLELFGAGSSREVFVKLKKLGEDEIVTATQPARGKR